MKVFLVHHNRRTETSVVRTFEDVASAAPLLRELESSKGRDEEVVLMFARSEEQLKKTHPRYFMPASEIARYSLAG